MVVIIGNEITIMYPNDEVVNYCKKELIVNNPDYVKKARLGLSTYNTPRQVRLYKINGENIIVPYGVVNEIKKFISDDDIIIYSFKNHKPLRYEYNISLRDYQKEAVNKLYKAGMGILEAPAGSGKTQIGLALIFKYQTKALWLTHTTDLVTQSYDRCTHFMDKSLLAITSKGKVFTIQRQWGDSARMTTLGDVFFHTKKQKDLFYFI